MNSKHYGMMRCAGRKEKERNIYDKLLAKMGILHKSGSLEELSYAKTAYSIISVVSLCTGGGVSSGY